MQVISAQLTKIHEIENALYLSIERRQEKLARQLNEQQQKLRQQEEREKKLKERKIAQQVTHPYNSALWMGLGLCIQDYQIGSLDDIRQRQIQRVNQRKRIQQQKQLQQKANQILRQEQNPASEDNLVKGNKKSKNSIQKQIPWKLMRKIRQHDVEQNLKILQRQQKAKAQRVYAKFRQNY